MQPSKRLKRWQEDSISEENLIKTINKQGWALSSTQHLSHWKLEHLGLVAQKDKIEVAIYLPFPITAFDIVSGGQLLHVLNVKNFGQFLYDRVQEEYLTNPAQINKTIDIHFWWYFAKPIPFPGPELFWLAHVVYGVLYGRWKEGGVPIYLSQLKNLRKPTFHFILVYLMITFGCDTRILKAIFYHWFQWNTLSCLPRLLSSNYQAEGFEFIDNVLKEMPRVT